MLGCGASHLQLDNRGAKKDEEWRGGEGEGLLGGQKGREDVVGRGRRRVRE